MHNRASELISANKNVFWDATLILDTQNIKDENIVTKLCINGITVIIEY